jgi:hypothetical protein
MEKTHEEISDALVALYPESNSSVVNLEIIWDTTETPISETDIDNKIIAMRAEYDANQYQRDRQAEYPSIAELTIALYDTSDKEALVTKRNAVKLKYPKPS